MLKKISAFIATLMFSAACFAAVDVNKGTAAELDGIKGLGPAKSKLILEERKKSDFKSWDDLISRVKGLGDKSAAKLSAEGLTVGGASYTAAGGKTEAKADTKADAKVAKPAAATKPAAAASAAK